MICPPGADGIDNPAQIKRWLKGAMRGLMFVRDRPEEAVGQRPRRRPGGAGARSGMSILVDTTADEMGSGASKVVAPACGAA